MSRSSTWISRFKKGLKSASSTPRGRSRGPRRCVLECLESREVLAASPIGLEFLANSFTENSQTFPSIAMDADGDFVVAWSSNYQDGDQFGIFAQRYNAAGLAQGDEFRVNTITANTQIGPVVAMDADGDFVIAWNSINQDGSEYGIYAQRFNAAGIAQGGEFRINTYTTGDQLIPAIAMDADGDFVIAWHSTGQDGSGFSVRAQRFNSAGAVQGSEFQVNTFTASDQMNPSVAMDSDGDFVVSWQSLDQDAIGGFGIYAQRYSARGVALGVEFLVNTFTTNSQINPALAMDADGDFVVAWQSTSQDPSGYGIYAQRYSSAGAPEEAEFRVDTHTTNDQSFPSVAMDADGDFVVTWNSNLQDGGGTGVYAKLYNAVGVVQGVEVRANTTTTGDQSLPAVAMDADGDFVVAWNSNSQDGSGLGIYAQRYDESTTTAGPMVTEVRDLDRQIAPGGRLSTTLDTLTVAFSEDLNVVGGSSGPNSVLNPANWQLTQDGVDISSLITGITFEPNTDTGKFEAELTLGAPLLAATYQLNVLDTIRGLTGNALDGDFNGTPGGNYQHAFALANIQSAGSEFRVNTFSTNSQNHSSVAMDADGDFVVTWTSFSQNTIGSDIYAQRYSASGLPLFSEFRVNTTVANNQLESSIAMDANGDFVVVWASYNSDSTDSDVYARRYNAAGVAQGGEFRVNTYTTGLQLSVSVAMDVDGDFVVTWASDGQDGDSYGIYAQRYNAAGAVQGSEFLVNTFTTDLQFDNAIAMDADGDFVVTWLTQDGVSSSISAQRYNAEGVARGSEFRVNAVTVNNLGGSSVAMDADGDFVVTWESTGPGGSGNGVYAQRYSAAGVAQGGEFLVEPFASSPSVAMDADGDFVVAWERGILDGSDDGVYARRYNSAGVAQGSEFQVNTFTVDDQKKPSVAMDADGDFVITWESRGQDGGFDGVYAQRYQSDAPVQLFTGVSGMAGMLSLTGTSLADMMSVERITPADAPVYLNVIRNGVEYSIDENKFESIIIQMSGSTGNDWLSVVAGPTTSATLNGDGGNDTLIGGAGNDTLNGGTGNDLFVFDNDTALGFDIVTDTSGSDTLDFSATETLALAVDLSINTNQIVNANHSIRLSSGNAFENIIGGAMGDTLIGNARPNRITGGGGNDMLTGGAGNDTYLFDADLVLGADTINESGGGVDTLDFSATTARNIAINLSRSTIQTVAPGRLSLTLSANNTIENVIGGALNDTITGNSLHNRLVGGLGDDSYTFDTDLSLGSDTIQDVGGIDTLNFSNTTARTIAVDLSNATPQVVTASRLTLSLSSGNSIENVIGGSLADTLTGNALDNTLTGSGGNDALNGSTGDDVYLFDTDLTLASDTIVDSNGIDTLDFSATTTRAVAIDLSNAASQVVNPGLSLTLSSATSIENVIGGDLGDTITGNTLANKLTGGPGSDALTGGSGNDTYIFSANNNLGTDTINEAGGGIDTLDFSGTTTHAISVNLSNPASQVVSPTLSLVLSADNTIENVIGGSLSDALTGNTLNNNLTGGGGNDVLTGGAGNDTYHFNTDLILDSDTINESGGGIDTLNFSSTLTRAIDVNLATVGAQTVTPGRLTLTLIADNTIENLVGGSLDDTLTGNSLNNSLTGGGGDDTLTGGGGDDSYFFDTDLNLGSDTVNEAGGGIDTLNFSQTTTRSIAIDLSNAGLQTVNAGLQLTLSSSTAIENVIGGTLNDTLTGNTLSNTLTGGGGDDTLVGGAGDDTYVFDTDLSLGSDTINDSNGIDTLDFSLTTTQRVFVDLSLATPQVVNSGLMLTLSAINAIENAIGGALSDILVGNALVNTLTGNSGDDVLAGRTGNDILNSGLGKNILIGGEGSDQLTGGTSEDLLLGGLYINENNFTALDSLLAEWTSASSFNDRIDHLLGILAGGLNNGFTLTRSTVKEDSSSDSMVGSNASDWYLRNSLGVPAVFRDTITDSIANSVFTEIDTWF